MRIEMDMFFDGSFWGTFGVNDTDTEHSILYVDGSIGLVAKDEVEFVTQREGVTIWATTEIKPSDISAESLFQAVQLASR